MKPYSLLVYLVATLDFKLEGEMYYNTVVRSYYYYYCTVSVHEGVLLICILVRAAVSYI